MQVRGKGQNIDNVGSRQASLKIIAVHDEAGNNLLAQPKCGEPVNSTEQFFTAWGGLKTAYVNHKPVTYNELEVRRKVKLKPGIRFSQVTSMEGLIELNLATQISREQFAKTDQNKVMSAFGSRILFKPSAVDTLSYTLSGDEQRVLAIRALNRDKQYLSRSSSSSMSSLWGSGRSVTQTYQGEIALVEVVYAKELEKITYPAAITKFPPYPGNEHWKYALEPAGISSVKEWNKKYQTVDALELTEENNWYGEQQALWHEGPFNLALYGLKTNEHWGTSGQLMIKTPIVDELRHNLSALEVYFNYPPVNNDADPGEQGKSQYFQLKAKGYYMNGEFIVDKEKLYMDGRLSFNLPYKNKQVPLKEINGAIIVHLPLSKHSNSYTDMSIGAQWEDEGVRVKIVRLGNEVMELEVLGNRSRLIQIVLLDAQNNRISTADIHSGFSSGSSSSSGFSSGMQKQEPRIIVNYHGLPVKALLTVSEGQQTKRYPFQLKLQ